MSWQLRYMKRATSVQGATEVDEGFPGGKSDNGGGEIWEHKN